MADVLTVVKTPFNWAKARPLVFLALLVVVAVLAIKYSAAILALFGRAPIVGGRVVAFAQPRNVAAPPY